MNRYQLVAKVVEREMLRYTPGGIPIVAGKLAHRSQQMEARVERLIELEISALAVGEISGRFSQLELDRDYQFSGFMARKNRNSKSLVFHVTEVNAAVVEVNEVDDVNQVRTAAVEASLIVEDETTN